MILDTPVHYSDIFVFEHHLMMWFITFGHHLIMHRSTNRGLSSNHITVKKSG